jgi:hypothetical protein
MAYEVRLLDIRGQVLLWEDGHLKELAERIIALEPEDRVRLLVLFNELMRPLVPPPNFRDSD